MRYNFKELDEESSFTRRKHMLKGAREEGFEYISEAIITLYLSGCTLREVADRLDVYLTTIRWWLRKWHVERRWAVEESLMSIPAIAEELGFSKQYIHVVLHRALEKFRQNWLEMYAQEEGEETLSDQDFMLGCMKQGGRKENK